MWLQFVNHLSSEVKKIIVISINNDPTHFIDMNLNTRIYNFPTKMPGNKGRSFNSHILNRKISRFPMGQVYQTLTLRKYIPFIQKCCEDEDIDIVHFPQPFGFGLDRLRKKLPSKVVLSISLSTYIKRLGVARRVYDYLKKKAVIGADIVIVPNTSVKNAATDMGIESNKLKVVNWAIDCTKFEYVKDKKKYKNALGIEGPLLLSTGPIQEIGLGKDVDFFIQLSKGIKCTKILAVKPDIDIADLHAKYGHELRIVNTDYEMFQQYLRAADLLVSPVHNRARTVPPPLTWIESAFIGTPVVTSNVPGAIDFIEPQTGIIGTDLHIMKNEIKKLIESPELLRAMSKKASNLIKARYTIKGFVSNMVDIWKDFK